MVFAAVCVVLGVAGHASMSAAPVPWWAPAGAFAALAVLAWAAARRERGLPGITVPLVVAQFSLHGLFGWAERFGPAPGVTLDQAMPTEHAQLSGARHAEVMGSAAHGGALLLPGHTSPGMLLGHLAAGVGSAWWLRRGERALFALLGLLASWASTLVALLRAWLRWGKLPFPRPRPVRRRPVRAVARWFCRPVTRRGPPVAAAVRPIALL